MADIPIYRWRNIKKKLNSKYALPQQLLYAIESEWYAVTKEWASDRNVTCKDTLPAYEANKFLRTTFPRVFVVWSKKTLFDFIIEYQLEHVNKQLITISI